MRKLLLSAASIAALNLIACGQAQSSTISSSDKSAVAVKSLTEDDIETCKKWNFQYQEEPEPESSKKSEKEPVSTLLNSDAKSIKKKLASTINETNKKAVEIEDILKELQGEETDEEPQVESEAEEEYEAEDEDELEDED